MNTPSSAPLARAALPSGLYQELYQQGPRYTSYPTADRFHAGIGPETLRGALIARAADPVRAQENASLYIHIPFCQNVCYYCACNKVITKHQDKAAPYLEALAQEMRNVVRHAGSALPINQLHLGGGTPTFFTDEQLSELMRLARSHFTLPPDAEISIEIDPRTVNRERLQHLWTLGFNRVSFGIQDFDPAVQQAIHRIQPLADVTRTITQARDVGFQSINADLIYGLPKQTRAGFAQTLSDTAALRPERIALFGYAHLPQRFKPQRRINAQDLPDPDTRIQLLQDAIDQLQAAGYVYIGMDHFALPADPLAQAKQAGTLNRNFQGYTTLADGDLIALGVSAISRVGNHYLQNSHDLEHYYELLHRDGLATCRGIEISSEDAWRARLIQTLMCRGELDLDQLSTVLKVPLHERLEAELASLAPMAEIGLLDSSALSRGKVTVTNLGWHFIRAIAMRFDPYLSKLDLPSTRFSQVV